MAVRVMTYIGLLWQDLARAGKLSPDGSLPAVLPLVLYNGETPWIAPRAIHEAMGPVPHLLQPFQPDCAFLLLDEVRMQLRDGHERNLAAAVFRLERSGDPIQHLAIARTIAGWLRGDGKVRIIAAFQRWYARTLTIRHNISAALNPFAEDAMLTTRFEEWKAGVKAEGKAEGRVAALVELVKAGDLPRTTAELRLRHMVEQGLIDADRAEAALRELC
jgi:hypothetical protein